MTPKLVFNSGFNIIKGLIYREICIKEIYNPKLYLYSNYRFKSLVTKVVENKSDRSYVPKLDCIVINLGVFTYGRWKITPRTIFKDAYGDYPRNQPIRIGCWFGKIK